MFAKLAFRNVKRQLGNYLIYFITVSLTVALMFAVNSVIFEEQLLARAQTISDLRTALTLITVFISVIVAFVLGYATSFMLKLRKREFGTYLTLGMTRSNIMCVFLLESLLLCVVSLGIGILLGLGFYQGLMAIVTNVMDVDFGFAAYSYQGLLLTVGLVLAIFALSSAASAVFLKRVSIYNLLHGAKKTEKAVRHPAVWCILAAVALVGIIVSIVIFSDAAKVLIGDVDNGRLSKIVMSLAVFGACVIVFHIGLSRGVIGLLMRTKKFKNRGANIFTFRQLSGKLSSSSVLMGLLAFLISFAVIGSNASFTQQIGTNAILDRDYPFDVCAMVRSHEEHDITFDEAEQIVSKYSEIKNRVDFSVYYSGDRYLHGFTDWGGSEYWMYYDSYIEESVFNRVYGEIGYKPVSLGDGFMIAAYDRRAGEFDFSQANLVLGGRHLSYKGFYACPLLGNGVYDFLVVVPDGTTAGMKSYYDGTVFSLVNTRYNAAQLRDDLMVSHEDEELGVTYVTTDYGLREYARLMQNASNAVFIVAALYIAVVFVLLAMAILALKTLSGISDDKQRYATLDRLGTSRRDMCRTLFRQIFTFFALPFALPLLISLPAGIICYSLMTMAELPIAATQAAAASGIIALVMLAVYALYFAATYLVSKRAVLPST
ncbi:MAG: ABC transporter permease [Clostridiales bacterium]|nr:ABC transporter permease [Clostridiales bacterium]